MRSQLGKYEEILDIINKYYPGDCGFFSEQYKNSKEHKRFTKKTGNLTLFEQKGNEYYNLICSVFPQYYVKRWTNATYPCFQFSVLLHKNQPVLDDDVELMNTLNGKRYNLEIFISRISNYYYVYTTEEIHDEESVESWIFNSHSETFILGERDIRQLNREMKKKGMYRLSQTMAHMEVPFIETELLPDQNHDVKVFNCLFSDMITDFY